MVLVSKLGRKNVLFTGDIGKDEEALLLQTYTQLGIDILKVGHHGSKISTSEEFIKKIQPADSVISCGVNNSFGHPHSETLQTLTNYQVQIFRTDRQGMIYYEWTALSPLSSAKYQMKQD